MILDIVTNATQIGFLVGLIAMLATCCIDLYLVVRRKRSRLSMVGNEPGAITFIRLGITAGTLVLALSEHLLLPETVSTTDDFYRGMALLGLLCVISLFLIYLIEYFLFARRGHYKPIAYLMSLAFFLGLPTFSDAASEYFLSKCDAIEVMMPMGKLVKISVPGLEFFVVQKVQVSPCDRVLMAHDLAHSDGAVHLWLPIFDSSGIETRSRSYLAAQMLDVVTFGYFQQFDCHFYAYSVSREEFSASLYVALAKSLMAFFAAALVLAPLSAWAWAKYAR